MRKHLTLLLVFILTGAPSGWADVFGLLDNVSADGSLEISGQQANNEADLNSGNNDHRGSVTTRLRVGLNADVQPGIQGRLEAVRNSQNGGGVVQFGDGPSTVHSEQTSIALQNAYLEFEDFLRTDRFVLGRQYGGRPGDLLVYYAPYNDDSLLVNPLDSLLIDKKMGPVNIQFVTGKVVEDDAVANTDAGDVTGDTNVNWVIFSSDELVPDLKIPLEFGYYHGIDHNTSISSDNDTLIIMDLRGGISLMDDALDLGLEYARNGGQLNGAGPGGSARDYKGSAILLKANYDDPAAAFGGRFKFALASGDDPNDANALAQDDSFHDFSILGWNVSDMRFGEIISNSNTFAAAHGSGPGLDTGALGPGVRIIGLGGYYIFPTLERKLSVNADYFMVDVQEVANGVNKGFGNEFDLVLNYDYSDLVKMSLGYAMFMPEQGLANGYIPLPANQKTDNVTKLFAKLSIRLGSTPAPQSTVAPAAAPAPAPRRTPSPAPARKPAGGRSR